MHQIEIDPDIANFVLFSGGGGLTTRSSVLKLVPGTSQVTIRKVPASIDTETLVIDVDNTEVTLREFVIKKPNRQYVDDNLKREAGCAHRLIADSVELGGSRPDILETCEAVLLKTYLDEEVYLVIWLSTEHEATTTLTLSYFVDDVRFRWKPTITVELEEDWSRATVKGLIAITNDSARRFDDVEVSFADFTKSMPEEAAKNVRFEPNEFKQQINKKRMKMMKIM